MLTQRIVVALIVGPVLLTATYFGGWYYFLPVFFLLITASVEYARIMQALDHRTPLWILLPAIAALLVGARFPGWNLSGVALFLAMFAGLIYCLWLFERDNTLDAALDWFALVTGIVLLGWLGGHFFYLRELPVVGWRWTALALMSIWTADMAAFAPPVVSAFDTFRQDAQAAGFEYETLDDLPSAATIDPDGSIAQSAYVLFTYGADRCPEGAGSTTTTGPAAG